MQQQNANNHSRYVPLFHFVLLSVILAVVVLAIIQIASSVSVLSVMLVLIAVALLIGFFMMRRFPIVAQDRAIRAEENLRHFALAGTLLHKDLSISQVVALRFADDDEFVELAARASQENMSNKEIKQAIKKWRADHHRA